LGTGIGKIAFNQIEICNSVQGQPYFSHNTMNIVQNITQSKLTGHLSISDEKNIAMAFTILEINL
jgi:phosphopantetheinyl transferase (holo-ACP synthase)